MRLALAAEGLLLRLAPLHEVRAALKLDLCEARRALVPVVRPDGDLKDRHLHVADHLRLGQREVGLAEVVGVELELPDFIPVDLDQDALGTAPGVSLVGRLVVRGEYDVVGALGTVGLDGDPGLLVGR